MFQINHLVQFFVIQVGAHEAKDFARRCSITAEEALKGRALTESSIREAMAAISQEFSPIDDVRASALYREQLAKNLLFRAYLATMQRASTLRVTDYVT